MGNYEQKPGTGVLFQNKKTDERQPDYKGEILSLEGKKLSIAMWKKTSSKGAEYFSVSISEPFKKDGKEDRKVINDIPF